VGIYRFKGFEIDLGVLELRREGHPLELRPRSVVALGYLIQHRHRLVGRDELMRVLWPNVRVAPGSLTQMIWEIRQALAGACAGRKMIATARGRGYRFTAQVEEP
jgi:DNA-binding winged helix-turn-helix (wHTH) protein